MIYSTIYSADQETRKEVLTICLYIYSTCISGLQMFVYVPYMHMYVYKYIY